MKAKEFLEKNLKELCREAYMFWDKGVVKENSQTQEFEKILMKEYGCNSEAAKGFSHNMVQNEAIRKISEDGVSWSVNSRDLV